MSADPLRSTLDHLALDPDAGQDRHYLVTMLRRLGYSDVEIREVLGDEGEEGRVIEVEYVGSGASTFTFGEPGSEAAAAAALRSGQGALQFTLAGEEGQPMQFKLAGDEAAGTDSFDAVALGEGDISDDWGDWNETPDDFVDSGSLDDGGFSVDGDDGDEGDEGDEVEFKEVAEVEFKERPSELIGFSAQGNDDPGWIPVHDDEWGAPDAPPGDAWAAPDDAWADAEEWAEVDDAPFTYEDYTLYTRPVELTTGKTQQIYFFAKDTPRSGEPCPMPEGYEVGVSEKTRLPFLRKIRDGTEEVAPVKAQCRALTEDDDQCRLTASLDSDYCHVHQGYQPPTAEEMRARMDTEPYWANAEDTLPGEQGDEKQQCAAITAAGHQCRNTARHGSKYCASHKGYHPRKPETDTDTRPVGRHVEDTLPAVANDPFDDEEWASADEPDDRTTTFGIHGSHDHEESAQPAPLGAAPGRLRMERVQAKDRKEAERLIAKRGGRVRGVVPVRVEESEVDNE